jgi:hypothetical protein
MNTMKWKIIKNERQASHRSRQKTQSKDGVVSCIVVSKKTSLKKVHAHTRSSASISSTQYQRAIIN